MMIAQQPNFVGNEARGQKGHRCILCVVRVALKSTSFPLPGCRPDTFQVQTLQPPPLSSSFQSSNLKSQNADITTTTCRWLYADAMTTDGGRDPSLPGSPVNIDALDLSSPTSPTTRPLYTSQYTDLTLLIGEEAAKFHVHRNIVSVHSEFFQIACGNPHFREGAERLVRLPEIDVETMTTILRWCYQAPLALPDDLMSDEGYEKVRRLLDAADYLVVENVVGLVARATDDYLYHCAKWSSDRKALVAGEQKKVDLLCRIYDSGGKMQDDCLRKYLRSLKESHKLGLFMNIVKELEDCHEKLFNDIMVALYSTVDE
ncbi:LOW QUALITY PROTEIN: hypothetical protein Dda_9234 [Drechslerella dactyloides]|uniref:BTB domain-containing protein n=1 Tax=Drechslerella dactyloides TaxID=74499 RepID=A0AAD6IPL7_DREDA|nr:LOW QUALITY PROTEIN: hypothetical protein Dda_9234 [Drechslerella dactyloides]